ncbi:ABC transporter permease [Nocardioides currus]|uniref:ABC transporter permease n=1 Tax=Nocardioides currus TaxID=2133958 RepID=A0A2R7Z389_9ACTN|nr:ABC transporter permease [Nocardioides currus]PUA82629.1 ABC transporter permease [Nocardioides currus]
MTATMLDRDISAGTALPQPGGRATRKQRKGPSLGLRIGLPLLVGVVLVGAWELVTRRDMVSPLLLPAPADVWSALDAGIIQGLWWGDIRVTLTEMVIGFGIGVVAGLLLGALFAYSAISRIAFYPYIIALQSFPKIAVAPLLVVALGYGMSPKIAVAASLAYFPVMTAAIAGFTEIDKDEHNFMRSIGASRWHEMRYLRMPNAMSYLFPSLDVALIVALLGAVAAELVGAREGLGYVLVERQAFGDTPAIFAALVVLAAIGVVLQALVVLLRRVLPRSVVPR